MRPNVPKRPDALDPLAVDLLERLRHYPEAERLILGGHFALKHYLDYRPTHDVDAWWPSDASESNRQALLARLRAILVEVAREHGLAFRERQTGTEVISLELRKGHKAVFTFQIAPRTVELERPIGRRGSPWSPIPIETLADNVGAKMNALVNRGAPRDFVDIYTVVTSDIVTVEELR